MRVNLSGDEGKEKNPTSYWIFDSHQGFYSFYLPAFVNMYSTSATTHTSTRAVILHCITKFN